MAPLSGRLAGAAARLAGTLWLLTAAGDAALRAGVLRGEAWPGLTLLPFVASLVPLALASALALRCCWGGGALARLGLALASAGSVGVLLALPLGAQPAAPGWLGTAAAASLLAIRLGWLVFGIAALRRRLLPRWNLAPVLVGASAPLSLPFTWFGAPPWLPLPGITPAWHFAVSGAAWLMLGGALTGSRATPPALSPAPPAPSAPSRDTPASGAAAD
ncbi:MAG: hypothetical protein KGS47_12875 [Chloroflexi bacterium]|nr:hypothetical protein [Chloroflexota bacterium]